MDDAQNAQRGVDPAYGSAAGPIRNEDMLIKHKPHKVIAFPGRVGTADMVKRAKKRKGAINVIEIVNRDPAATATEPPPKFGTKNERAGTNGAELDENR